MTHHRGAESDFATIDFSFDANGSRNEDDVVRVSTSEIRPYTYGDIRIRDSDASGTHAVRASQALGPPRKIHATATQCNMHIEESNNITTKSASSLSAMAQGLSIPFLSQIQGVPFRGLHATRTPLTAAQIGGPEAPALGVGNDVLVIDRGQADGGAADAGSSPPSNVSMEIDAAAETDVSP